MAYQFCSASTDPPSPSVPCTQPEGTICSARSVWSGILPVFAGAAPLPGMLFFPDSTQQTLHPSLFIYHLPSPNLLPPRALVLGWDQLFSASAYPTPRVVSVYLILLCNPFSGHPLPGSLGLVASPPSIWPPNRFPAQAKRPWPQGGRLRPHPAPSPAPPPHSAERIG